MLETLGNSLADHLNMAHYSGPASESQRVMHLNKKRERELEEIEIKKRKLENDLKVEKMESKFSAHYDAVAEDLKSSTVGLLTLEDLKSRQENAVKGQVHDMFSRIFRI